MWDGARWVSTQPDGARGRRSRVWLWTLGGCSTVLVLALAGAGLWVYSLVQGFEHGSNTCLPAEFPRYPGATYVEFTYELNGTYPGNTCDVVLETNDAVDTVVGFYGTKLNTGAWQVTSRGNPPDQVTFQAASSFAPFGTVKVAVKTSARTDITIDVFTSTCLPLGFPQNPRAVFGAMSTESTSAHRTCDVVLESNDDVAAVTAFYLRNLNTGNWQVTSSAPGKVGFSLRDARRKTAAYGTVTIAVVGDRTEIKIDCTE